MTESTQSNRKQYLAMARKEFDFWTRSLELAVTNYSYHNFRVGNEFNFVGRVWTKRKTRFENLFSQSLDPAISDIRNLLSLLPPGNTVLRFHLDRLSHAYDELCLATSDDISDLFAMGEAAVDRGDYDIGLNILRQVCEKEPRYFPGLMVYGYACVASKTNVNRGIQILNRALANPPAHQQQHFIQLIIELLAWAYQVAERPLNAVQSLKRLNHMEADTTSSHYMISRNYSIMGQKAEAMDELDHILKNEPEFLALSIVDKGFTQLKKPLELYLEERTELIHEANMEVLEKLRAISDRVEMSGLHEDHDSVRQHIQLLENIERLQEDGCYSTFQDIQKNQIPRLIPEYPTEVIEILKDRIQKVRNSIELENANLEQEIAEQKKQYMKTGLIVWGSVVALVVIVQIFTSASALSIFSSVLILTLLGIPPTFYLDNRMNQVLSEKKKGMDPAVSLEHSLRDIQSFHSDLVGRLQRAT